VRRFGIGTVRGDVPDDLAGATVGRAYHPFKGGGSGVSARTGDVWFFWLQYLGADPPPRAEMTLSISDVPF
jgi:hypothetical protein